MQFTQKSRSLLPLDRADGLGREVVTHAADAGDPGGDVGGDALEQWPCAVESSGSAGQQVPAIVPQATDRARPHTQPRNEWRSFEHFLTSGGF